MSKELALLLIFIGSVLVLLGGLLLLSAHTGFRMPFDMVIRGKNYTVYFPLGTSILISIVLTIVLSIIFKSK